LVYLGGLAALFALGVWACDVTGRALGDADHGAMVWDETVAFLLVLFFTPVYSYWQAFAFLLFRLFDIAKPQPIRYYERTVKGGLGVMIDDIVAAFYTLLVLAAARAVVA
jgi:phosphatidylglycerophosphatase A